MFNSAMIAGISAIIDPRGPDSDQMRKILTTFLEQNPWIEVANKDETTRKEVQIVSLMDVLDASDPDERYTRSLVEPRKFTRTRSGLMTIILMRRTRHLCYWLYVDLAMWP